MTLWVVSHYMASHMLMYLILDCEVLISFIALRLECRGSSCLVSSQGLSSPSSLQGSSCLISSCGLKEAVRPLKIFFLCDDWRICPYYIFTIFYLVSVTIIKRCFSSIHHCNFSHSLLLMDYRVLVHFVDVGIILITKSC